MVDVKNDVSVTLARLVEAYAEVEGLIQDADFYRTTRQWEREYDALGRAANRGCIALHEFVGSTDWRDYKSDVPERRISDVMDDLARDRSKFETLLRTLERLLVRAGVDVDHARSMVRECREALGDGERLDAPRRRQAFEAFYDLAETTCGASELLQEEIRRAAKHGAVHERPQGQTRARRSAKAALKGLTGAIVFVAAESVVPGLGHVGAWLGHTGAGVLAHVGGKVAEEALDDALEAKARLEKDRERRKREQYYRQMRERQESKRRAWEGLTVKEKQEQQEREQQEREQGEREQRR